MAKILLAEDDDSLRGFLVNALKRAGHVVKNAAAATPTRSLRPAANALPSMTLLMARRRWEK